MSGKVWLIGAGPGDLELLTLKAVRALSEADIVMIDDLVNPDIVQFSPRAKIIPVGKRGGCKSTPQAFILRLMLRYARQGKTVARLKGGDPSLFGRGGEEVAYLQAANIAVEVVNGITSGLAAATQLGVPLTHRDWTQGVTFITAHAQDDSAPDWGALAATGTTLVIYMGMSRIDALADGLLAHLPPTQPAAVVQWASTPREQRLVTTLGKLAADATEGGFASPAIIIVGDVLRLANAHNLEGSTGLRQQA